VVSISVRCPQNDDAALLDGVSGEAFRLPPASPLLGNPRWSGLARRERCELGPASGVAVHGYQNGLPFIAPLQLLLGRAPPRYGVAKEETKLPCNRLCRDWEGSCFVAT
jgi:hypothetical protein